MRGDRMLAAVNGYYDGSHIIINENVVLKIGHSVVVTY